MTNKQLSFSHCKGSKGKVWSTRRTQDSRLSTILVSTLLNSTQPDL